MLEGRAPLHTLPCGPLLPLSWKKNLAEIRRSNKVFREKCKSEFLRGVKSGSVFSTAKKVTVRYSDQEIYFRLLRFLRLRRMVLDGSSARECFVHTPPPSSCSAPCPQGAVLVPAGSCCSWPGVGMWASGWAVASGGWWNPARPPQCPSPAGKARTPQEPNSSQFTPKCEYIAGAYASRAGKEGVKTTLQEVLIYKSKAPSKLYRKVLEYTRTVT